MATVTATIVNNDSSSIQTMIGTAIGANDHVFGFPISQHSCMIVKIIV